MPDLLIELFSEEIPARMQAQAADDLKRLVTQGLVDAGLTYESAGAFATPRRLALSVSGLLDGSPASREERKGPRIDAPDAALQGFLRSTGLTKDDLEARDDKKGQVWFALIEKPGRSADAIVAEVLAAAVANFPWPKSMRWGAGGMRWVRPLHSVLCILSAEDGARIVPVEIDGVKSGDSTAGHRFLSPKPFSVISFEDYEAKLKRAHVILRADERAEAIWHEASQMAFAQGLELVEDKGLLAEVAGLVEWPVVLMGAIGEDFLDLPPEVLQTSMKTHQKFFSVRNPKTARIEKYVTVANRSTDDKGAMILAGNGRVLAARLADAKFFWENDLRKIKAEGLEGMGAGLADVTFHNKLGSQAERVERIARAVYEIAAIIGADPYLAAQAARVAKADLMSAMVGEFPELQGLMGRYYAEAQGLPAPVAMACQQHYSPLGPSDTVPTEPVSVAVALADKIDTLTGFWAIDEKPTGSKDPFALRRTALGVIRLVLTGSLRLDLFNLLSWSTFKHVNKEEIQRETGKAKDDPGQYWAEQERVHKGLIEKPILSPTPDETSKESVERVRRKHFPIEMDLLSFLHDRLKVHLRDEGIRHDVIDACLPMPGNDDLVLLVSRIRALQHFVSTEDGTNLLAGFKRANNILSAEEKKDGVSYELDPEARLAEGAEEKALFAALDKAEAAIAPALKREDFGEAMAAMASLRAPIDAFFEGVTVNADQPILRRNRLCLLNRIRAVMGQVSVFSAIEG